MSDDEDYMSDKFLSGPIEDDVRPGLILSHSEKRNFQALKRKKVQDEINKKKNPSIKVVESEKRREGLAKPIDANNKGFALLQKMGYKPGTSIGKNEKGRAEPIPINVKADREGLGRAQMRQEAYENQLKLLRKNDVSTSEFRSRLTEKDNNRQTENDVRKSQKICEYLDNENGVLEPCENWYWLSTDSETENNDECSKEINKHTKSNLYYDSDECGDDHLQDNRNLIEEEENSDEENSNDRTVQNDLNVIEKLNCLTTYLRRKYFYCIWCSVKYEDEQDLLQVCPGRCRDDH